MLRTVFQTIKLKLNLSSEQRDIFLRTAQQYSYAAQKVVDYAFDNKVWKNISLHNGTYHTIKADTQLPSQLICSARLKAFESIKAYFNKKGKQNKPCFKTSLSIRYDARSFSINISKGFVSLATIQGRQKVNIHIPEYYRQYLDWKVCTADLVFDRPKKCFFLHIVFSKEFEESDRTGDTIGVDLGLNNIAVTSSNFFFKGSNVKNIKNRYFRLRKQLQAKGTPSARRKLKRIAKKEQRFMRDVNHCISKSIVSRLPVNSVIVFENLKDIRERAYFGRRFNRAIHSWAFRQLQTFVDYKAGKRGIACEFVESKYTSQTCSRCGCVSKSQRRGHTFKCSNCGYELNADLNGSRNILKRYLQPKADQPKAETTGGISSTSGLHFVNQPIVAGALTAKAHDAPFVKGTAAQFSYKSRAL